MKSNENIIEMKKVTIMIPTYNQSQYIEQCIDSALAQTYENLEIIVSDDSTNNETEKIINEKYRNNEKITYYRNNPPLGRVGNYRKTLYERASGDYVLNLDGDDWLIDRNYILDAVKLLEKDKEIVCVFAKIKQYNETTKNFEYDNSKNLTFSKKMTGEEFFYKYSYERNISFNHLTLLYRKTFAISVDFYDMDIILSDGYSFGKLVKKKHIGYIDRFVGVWRQHTSNASSEVSIIAKQTDISKILEHITLIIEYYKDTSFTKTTYKNWARRFKTATLYPHLSSAVKSKDFKTLKEFLINLHHFDTSLFHETIIYFFVTFIKSTFRIIFRKATSLLKNISRVFSSKVSRMKINLLQINIILSEKISFGKNVTIGTSDNGAIVIGKNVVIEDDVELTARQGKITIGDNTFIGKGSQIISKESITIGKDCLIAAYSIIRDVNHGIKKNKPINIQAHDIKEIIIEDDVWLGSHSTIIAGVKICKGAVVGANAVVTKDVEPYTVVGGVPAKFIKNRED